MLKVTRLADYSVLILCCFQDRKLTAKNISTKTGLGIATVNKILSLLVKAKILKPLREQTVDTVLQKPKRSINKRYYRSYRRACGFN